MAIQPFATQIQAPQIQTTSPINQMGQLMALRDSQQQNQLRGMQMGQLQQGIEQENALRSYLGSGADLSTPESQNRLFSFGKAGIDVQKALRDSEAARLTGQKGSVDLADAKLKQARAFLDTINPTDPTAPQQFMAWHEANHRDSVIGPLLAERGITAEQSRARIEQAIQQGPQAFAQLVTQSALGLDEFTKQNKTQYFTQDTGGGTRVVGVPGLGGAATVVPGSAVTKTLTPEQRRAADQELTKVANTVTDEAGNVTLYNAFGQIIRATDASGAPVKIAGKPSAQFEKTRALRAQLDRDLTSTIAELKSITEEGGLIDQSTGSGAGRATDAAAGFFGVATPGAIAAASLKPIADLALKLVPRFEGPQSDKDTTSYKEAAGQLADSSLPAATRKAAGKTVLRLMESRKNQFVTQNMADEGTTAEGTAGAQPAPASGTRSFATVAEAEAANLPPNTKITIGGRPATVQ